jgi:hypothetical protein
MANRSRMPDTDFDAEQRETLRAALQTAHHPSAAQENLAREKRALAEARAQQRAALAH